MYFLAHHGILLCLGCILQLAAAANTIPQSASNGTVTITNPAGKAISPPTVALSPHYIQKRANRPVTGCPPGYSAEYSHCQAGRSSRAYLIMCTINFPPRQGENRPWRTLVTGECLYHEICIWTTVEGPPRADTAFCVALDTMVQFTIDTRDKNIAVSAGASQVGLPSLGRSSSQFALEAVLTGLDTGLSLNVSSLRVQAQKAINVHGHIVYQTLPGGMGFCTNCAEVSVDPVPQGTQKVTVDMILETGTQVGSLFLGAFEL